MNEEKKITKEIENTDQELTERDLIGRRVCFSKIYFGDKKDPDIKTTWKKKKLQMREIKFEVLVNWRPLAIRRDQTGIIIGCDFQLLGEEMGIKTSIQTEMRFDKPIPEEQILKTCFLQTLAAKLYFPFLIELVATNTSKLRFFNSPLILDTRLLDQILEATTEKGPFQKITQKPTP